MGAIERAQQDLAEKMSQVYLDRAAYKENLAHEEPAFALPVSDNASDIEQDLYEAVHVKAHEKEADTLYAEAEQLDEWNPTEVED